MATKTHYVPLSQSREHIIFGRIIVRTKKFKCTLSISPIRLILSRARRRQSETEIVSHCRREWAPLMFRLANSFFFLRFMDVEVTNGQSFLRPFKGSVQPTFTSYFVSVIGYCSRSDCSISSLLAVDYFNSVDRSSIPGHNVAHSLILITLTNNRVLIIGKTQ